MQDGGPNPTDEPIRLLLDVTGRPQHAVRHKYMRPSRDDSFWPHAARCVGWNTNPTCDVTNSFGAGTINRRILVHMRTYN